MRSKTNSPMSPPRSSPPPHQRRWASSGDASRAAQGRAEPIWRRRLMLAWVSGLAVCSLSAWAAAAQPYPPGVDAKAQIAQAVHDAALSHRAVLVIFGANWCEDCQALDQALHRSQVAEWVSQRLVVVKVDVGNFDRNLDLDAQYGKPIAQGIPAAVMLSPSGELRYATRAGELANARGMDDAAIVAFFKQVLQAPTMQDLSAKP